MVAELIETHLRAWQGEIDYLATDPARRAEYERGCLEIVAAREQFEQAKRNRRNPPFNVSF